MIIDTHTHAWGPPSRNHPWVNGPLVSESVDAFDVSVVYDRATLRADLDGVGVDRAVVVGYPITEWTDNSYTIETSMKNRFAGIGLVDPFASDAGEIVTDVLAHEDMLGIRLAPMCPRDRMWEAFDYSATWLLDAIDQVAFWDAVRAADGLVQLLAHTSQLDQVQQLVDTYPDLTYLLDHWCHADAATPPGTGPLTALETLAQSPCVAMKLSETAYFSGESFPYPDVHPHLEWLLDEFGRERVVWGSDYPNITDPTYGGTSYVDSLAWLDHVSGLSSTDREWITGRAFRDLSGM